MVSSALKAMVQVSQPLEILTESFYWIAGRAREQNAGKARSTPTCGDDKQANPREKSNVIYT
jgi:hypothetical protein